MRPVAGMDRPRSLSLATFLVTVAISMFSAAPGRAGIVGSSHDFSAAGWARGEVCVPCHTPHNAITTLPDAPLWNHTLSTATYTLYWSSTLQQVPGQPGSRSKVCLSCHDGTVALNSFGGDLGSTFISGSAVLGTDLSDDHPVGIPWVHQGVVGSCSQCHPIHGGPISGPVHMYGGKVECPSCHNVHNDANLPKLLVVSNAGSGLCKRCHTK